MSIWENLKWLFNHPPTDITRTFDKTLRCDYCDSDGNENNNRLWNMIGTYCICEQCRKKVFDSVLSPKPIELSKIPKTLETSLGKEADTQETIMSRKVTFGSQEHTTVFACDGKGHGNANHRYAVQKTSLTVEEACNEEPLSIVHFQEGPIKENGINGIHNEDLLCIVLDRLQGFQAGDFACGENAIAYTYIETALKCLRLRTEDRKKQGVEGTNTKREVVPTPEEVILRYNKGGIKI